MKMQRNDDGRGPALGEPAPYFTGLPADIMPRPKKLKGHWFVIISHPDDIVPVFRTRTIHYVLCKRKIKIFSLECGAPSGLGAARNRLSKYMKRHSVATIADPDREIAKSYGLIKGPESPEDAKGVFVVDPQGILRIKLYSDFSVQRNFYEILKLVDALQTADRQRSRQAGPGLWKRGLDIVIRPGTAENQG
jgi:peroxiredoxin (alkyl hydroperoxide reductase subunit C)